MDAAVVAPLTESDATPAQRAAAQKAVDANAPGPLQCFRTQQDALAIAFGDASIAALSDAQLTTYVAGLATAGASPNATPGTGGGTYGLGTDYWDWHYTGTSLTWYGGVQCSASVTYVVNNIGSTWNDKISSALSYPNTSGCGDWMHYPNANLGGDPNYDYYRNCGYQYGGGVNCKEMGLMNDQTTSLKWLV